MEDLGSILKYNFFMNRVADKGENGMSPCNKGSVSIGSNPISVPIININN